MALTPKEEKLLKSKQRLLKDIISMEDRGFKTAFDRKEVEEEIAVLQGKQNTKLSQSLKISKSISKAGDDYDKVLKSQEKSLSSILGKLVQGNIAGVIEEGLAKKALNATEKRAKQNQNIQNSLKQTTDSHQQQADFAKLEGEDKIKVLDLINGINSGLLTQVDVQAVLEDMGEKKLSQSSELGKMLFAFADTADKEKVAKEETEEAQLRFNKHLGRGAMIFTALAAIAKKFAGSVDAIGKGFGSLNVTSDQVKHNLMDAEIASVGIGATMEDVVAVSNDIASDFGVGAKEATQMSAQLLDTAKAVGLTNTEAAKLSGILQTTSGLTAKQAEQLTEGVFQLAHLNNVAPQAVLQDMAGAAEEFASFSKDGGDNLAAAAVQARAMGLSLATTSKIAEGLLDFEQSITKEVEASVLIGRQLNLQKAREAALTGDIEEAMRVVVDQLGSEAEFNKLNVIQRKALADSIGVSVADMAKMVANQEKSTIAVGESVKSFKDIAGKEAMSNLTAAMNELTKFGVAIAQILGPIIELALKIVNPIIGLLGKGMEGLASAFRMDFGGAKGIGTRRQNANDIKAGPGGITALIGPSGVIGLNPRDSVMATTNRLNDVQGGMGGIQSYPAGTLGKGGAGGGTVHFESVTKGRDIYTIGTYYGQEFGETQLGKVGSNY